MGTVQLRRWTRQEYEQLLEAGVLRSDERVELIEGEIIEVPPQHSRHATGVRLAEDALRAIFRPGFDVRAQLPLALGQYSEPQPDVALLRPRADFYASVLPTPVDILLLIEVAETSLEYDRQVKLPLYARNGVLESWLVQLDRDQITVHRDPSPTGYQTVETVRRGERLTILALPDLALTADDLLG